MVSIDRSQQTPPQQPLRPQHPLQERKEVEAVLANTLWALPPFVQMDLREVAGVPARKQLAQVSTTFRFYSGFSVFWLFGAVWS
jgi:hypothetical protein